MADQDPNAQNQPMEEENVDQFYDDGGETFLPADHVSKPRPLPGLLAAVCGYQLKGASVTDD